jgi:hypothetical protein
MRLSGSELICAYVVLCTVLHVLPVLALLATITTSSFPSSSSDSLSICRAGLATLGNFRKIAGARKSSSVRYDRRQPTLADQVCASFHFESYYFRSNKNQAIHHKAMCSMYLI